MFTFFQNCLHIFVNASTERAKTLVNYLTQIRRRLWKSRKISWGVFFLLFNPYANNGPGCARSVPSVDGTRRSVGVGKCYFPVFMWRHHWELPFTLSESTINCELKFPSFCFTCGGSICRDICQTNKYSYFTLDRKAILSILFFISHFIWYVNIGIVDKKKRFTHLDIWKFCVLWWPESYGSTSTRHERMES